MRNFRRILITIALPALLGALCANAEYKAGYYDMMDGKKKEALKAAAKACVSGHSSLPYYDLPDYWQYSDVYPELVNGLKRWWEMYSDRNYYIAAGVSGKSSFSQNGMQREHSVPKSWWKVGNDVEYTPAYTDMWNLYPSDASANLAKSNYPFGEVRTTDFDNGVTKVGIPKQGYGGGAAKVFEPADEYKGDFARTIFYMATVYDNLPWKYDWMFVQNSYPTLLPWAYNMLLQWARQDPVSQKEIDRNNIVEQYQKNRNPFVDFPNLAEYIWGVSTEEVFIIADQENLDPTPPIDGDPVLTKPADGLTLDFGQVASGLIVNRTLEIAGKNLTSPLSLRVSGTNKNFFVPATTSIPASTMNSKGGYLLNIAYMPTSVGTHEAKVILYDGGLSGSVSVTLKGEALEMPVLTALHALEPVDVTDNSYTARWEAAQGVADYYTITRVKYTEGNLEVETYETGETSYKITDRNPSVAESYTVTYTRLGVESPTSNSVYVAASGVNDIRMEAPYSVYTAQGGFTVARDNGHGGTLRVYDASGRIVLEEDNPEDGNFYELSSGVYLVSVAGARPQKIIVM